jgi:hypothetical protein
LKTFQPLQSPKATAQKQACCVQFEDGLEAHLNFSTLELAHEKLFSIFQDILGR